MRFSIRVTDLPVPKEYDIKQYEGKISDVAVKEHLKLKSDEVRCLLSVVTNSFETYHLCIVTSDDTENFIWLDKNICSIGESFFRINPDLIAEAKDFLSRLEAKTSIISQE